MVPLKDISDRRQATSEEGFQKSLTVFSKTTSTWYSPQELLPPGAPRQYQTQDDMGPLLLYLFLFPFYDGLVYEGRKYLDENGIQPIPIISDNIAHDA